MARLLRLACRILVHALPCCLVCIHAADAQDGWYETYGKVHASYSIQNGKVVEVRNISASCMELAVPNTSIIYGKVIKRCYEKDEIHISGAVIERNDNSRTYINISTYDMSDISMNALGWISSGLENILTPGNYVNFRVEYCGVAGHVIVAHDLALANAVTMAPKYPAQQVAQPQSIDALPAGDKKFEVGLIKEGATYKVPVKINGVIELQFLVDSGASDVVLPADVVMTLSRAGAIADSDFIGEQTYRLADGRNVKSATFRIRQLQVGDKIIENVLGSVGNVNGSLLLGQSFLSRFKKVSFDYGRGVLVLE